MKGAVPTSFTLLRNPGQRDVMRLAFADQTEKSPQMTEFRIRVGPGAPVAAVLAVSICLAQNTAAQDRKNFDDGFDADFSVLFEAPAPRAFAKAISPDGRYRVVSESGSLEVRSVENDELLHKIPMLGNTVAPTFTPDSKQLFAVTYRGNLGSIGEVFLIDLETGNRIRLGECSGVVHNIGFDQEAKRLVIATSYSPVFCLKTKNGRSYGGEIVIFDTAKPNTSLRLFCELTGIPDLKSVKQKGIQTARQMLDEIPQRIEDAKQRCLPVRVGLTTDGTKVISVTAGGIVQVFDAQTGDTELMLGSRGGAIPLYESARDTRNAPTEKVHTESALHIITGDVIEIRTTRGVVVDGIRWQTRLAKIAVREVMKGEGIKVGQQIRVKYYRKTRVGSNETIPDAANSHDPVPKEGQNTTVYLKQKNDGINAFEVVHPHGFTGIGKSPGK